MDVRVIGSRLVKKTRKTHNCYGCDENYPKGNEMWSTSIVVLGEMSRVYLCKKCSKNKS